LEGSLPAVTLTRYGACVVSIKTYGTIRALDNLSMSVPAGAIGLLGPNGSGKTTLIRTLLRLVPCDEGVLRLVFESDSLDFLISFESGFPVQLAGTLELDRANVLEG
jgi:ABC-type polysaccharide/polyol phosphate transport system ATPase subunit